MSTTSTCTLRAVCLVILPFILNTRCRTSSSTSPSHILWVLSASVPSAAGLLSLPGRCHNSFHDSSARSLWRRAGAKTGTGTCPVASAQFLLTTPYFPHEECTEKGRVYCDHEGQFLPVLKCTIEPKVKNLIFFWILSFYFGSEIITLHGCMKNRHCCAPDKTPV